MRVMLKVMVEVPDDIPMDEVEEWAKFELGMGAMSEENPLSGRGLNCVQVDVESAA